MSEITWILFVPASLAVILSPGPDMVLVLSRGISNGTKGGVVCALGISSGLVGHSLLAAFGLGAVLQTSEVAFQIVKYVGAGYLCYLAIRMFIASRTEMILDQSRALSYKKIYLQGVIANLTNPKVALFYFAFLPQFVPLGAEQGKLSILIMGLCFGLLTLFIKTPFGYFAGQLSGWLVNRPKVIGWMQKISASVLLGLGVRLALEGRA